MDKIVFKIVKDEIIVSLLEKDIKENLNNTNVINVKETYFNIKYISENIELVSSFLNVIIIKNNIHKCVINDKEATLITLKLINEINKIDEIVLNYDDSLKYDEFLEILNNKTFKKNAKYCLKELMVKSLLIISVKVIGLTKRIY